MSQTSTIERRLSELEEDVARLQSRLDSLPSSSTWVDQITGSFKDDPEFDEILRLGREIRQADRPDAE